jgi:hypothetical protein
MSGAARIGSSSMVAAIVLARAMTARGSDAGRWDVLNV